MANELVISNGTITNVIKSEDLTGSLSYNPSLAGPGVGGWVSDVIVACIATSGSPVFMQSFDDGGNPSGRFGIAPGGPPIVDLSLTHSPNTAYMAAGNFGYYGNASFLDSSGNDMLACGSDPADSGRGYLILKNPALNTISIKMDDLNNMSFTDPVAGTVTLSSLADVPSLSDVLTEGNSAGANTINMNNNAITNAGGVSIGSLAGTISTSSGALVLAAAATLELRGNGGQVVCYHTLNPGSGSVDIGSTAGRWRNITVDRATGSVRFSDGTNALTLSSSALTGNRSVVLPNKGGSVPVYTSGSEATGDILRWTSTGWELGKDSGGVTVASSGGDYTTVGAAITAGAKHIFVKAGTYVESSIVLPDGVEIYGEGGSGDAILDFGSAGAFLTLGNKNSLVGLTFRTGSDAASFAMILASSKSHIAFERCFFESTHVADTVNSVEMVSVDSLCRNIRIVNCRIAFPAVTLVNLHGIVMIGKACSVDGLYVSSSSAQVQYVVRVADDCWVNNVNSVTQITQPLAIYNASGASSISNCSNISAQTNGTGSQIVNCDCPAIVANGTDTIISGCAAPDLTVGNRCMVSNCDIGILNIGAAADNSSISNCNISGTITWASGANDVQLNNCRVTSAAFTILAPGAMVTSCKFNNAVTLEGINAVLSGNYFSGAVVVSGTVPSNNNVINGNRFIGGLTLQAGTSGSVVDSNKGTVTDSGANNLGDNFA